MIRTATNRHAKSSLIVPIAMLAAPMGSSAATAPVGIVPGNGSATFRYTTAVQTPKGSHSGSGTITVKRTGDRAVNLTIQSDDGKPSHTIALIVGIDGAVAPDPSAAPAPSTDAEASAQAKAFMAQMTLAARVGIGIRKNAGASSVSAPVTLTPVGTGTPVSTTLAMNGTSAQYTGSTTGQTMTQLPQGGGLDPEQIVKSAGVAAVAHHAFTPAGRAATAVIMHRRRREQKEEASGMLPDAITLAVTANLADGKIHDIGGMQTDKITLQGKPVDIKSTWKFTKVAV